ncbi:MAG TPA: hypothetical protein VHA71_06490 [Rhodanobacteraceae bacterium]|jgi:hypothetical protein|nr:hypothetical protein [Rhodanobacteraceae bacterium]
MKSMTILLCCALVAGAANAQSTASASQPQPPRILAAPGAAASDAEIADFFVACASANEDEVVDKKILHDLGAVSDADTSINHKEATYYFISATAYSTKEYTKRKFTDLRNASVERVQGKISGGNLMDVIKEEMNYDESQIALCTFYTGKNNAKITAHVKQSGVLNDGPTKPN